ncbi:MAG: DUF6776 family protein, partial [Pseudohongiellaceae bacterium]
MPNVVKGSKQEKMIVVPHRPLRRVVVLPCLLLGVAVSVAAGFGYGYYTSLQQEQVAREERGELLLELARAKSDNEELGRQLAMLDRSSRMDQGATAELQETLSGLRQRLSELERENLRYRRVVTEQAEDTGLTIDQFDMTASAEPGHYRFRLVLRQQDADGDTYLLGHANVDLVGRMADGQKILPLRDVSTDEQQLDIRLRFRYFQNIEGELALPE